jgi:hypothetical protein
MSGSIWVDTAKNSRKCCVCNADARERGRKSWKIKPRQQHLSFSTPCLSLHTTTSVNRTTGERSHRTRFLPGGPAKQTTIVIIRKGVNMKASRDEYTGKITLVLESDEEAVLIWHRLNAGDVDACNKSDKSARQVVTGRHHDMFWALNAVYDARKPVPKLRKLEENPCSSTTIMLPKKGGKIKSRKRGVG